MNEEVNNNKNKKKQKIAILIGIVTLLIAVLGATYAYFQIDTNTESSNTKITGSTPDSSLVTLEGVTNNLHLNISASDMSLDKQGTEYYADDDIENNYVLSEGEGTHTIAKVGITEGEETTKYSCTAKLTISKVTEEDPDTMIEVLHSGDMILQFKGNIISNKLDLSDLKDTGIKEYNLKFNISGNTPEEIQAYIKLLNKNENQNYIAGRKLNIDINTSDLKCNVAIVDTTVAQLRYEDTQGYLSEELQGGMYRYQAAPADENEAAQMSNWICFGTKDKEACTNPETGIDKYMYRIIGITEEGQLYLLKETFVKEGSVTGFSWNDEYKIDSGVDLCPDGKCPEWNEADLFQRINGTANGTKAGKGDNDDSVDDNTDIFVDSSEYDYLKSGDTNSGGEASDWYNLIADHEWMYGDTNGFSYNGDTLYNIETGQTETTHYAQNPEGSTTVEEQTYTWSQKVNAKISLMYLHDVAYAYYDGSQENTRGNPGSAANVKNSWIHFPKDGYNTSPPDEWLSTRWGVTGTSIPYVYARYMDKDGDTLQGFLTHALGVRPVFYLESSTKIASGGGTKANPYILEI